jgi:hypothetical protein
MAMVEKKTRYEEDVWRAGELLAEIMGVPVAEIARVGFSSYVSFLMGRLSLQGHPAAESLWALFDESKQSWLEAGQRAAENWPL